MWHNGRERPPQLCTVGFNKRTRPNTLLEPPGCELWLQLQSKQQPPFVCPSLPFTFLLSAPTCVSVHTNCGSHHAATVPCLIFQRHNGCLATGRCYTSVGLVYCISYFHPMSFYWGFIIQTHRLQNIQNSYMK